MALYHVTKTRNLPKIHAKGLLRFQPSNWVQAANGERYGEGEIYAFENLTDALRWAAKMDWTFHQAMGSGKIAIVKFAPGANDWEVDNADPLSQAAAKGRWLKSERPIPPAQILGSAPVTQAAIKPLASRDEPHLDFKGGANG